MPQYVNPLLERAPPSTTGAIGSSTSASPRHQAEEYIRTTVVLATVLFLLALS